MSYHRPSKTKASKNLLAGIAEIGGLSRKVSYLQDSCDRRERWLAEAKEAAGYHRWETFDNVWAAALKALKEKRERGETP